MKKWRVYLDNCCFNRPYDNQTQERIYLESMAKMYIQQLIVDAKIDFIWSYILEYENSRNPYGLRKDMIRGFSYRCIEYVDKTNEIEIINQAHEIMRTGVKEKDALHIACAIYSNCDYFITTDDRLLHFYSDKIWIKDPMQFIRETEDTV